MRIAKIAGLTAICFLDGQDVVKDLNSDGSTVDYLNGPGIDNKLRLTDSRLSATGPLYFLQDHLGSTTALTNSLGVVTSKMSYDALAILRRAQVSPDILTLGASSIPTRGFIIIARVGMTLRWGGLFQRIPLGWLEGLISSPTLVIIR